MTVERTRIALPRMTTRKPAQLVHLTHEANASLRLLSEAWNMSRPEVIEALLLGAAKNWLSPAEAGAVIETGDRHG